MAFGQYTRRNECHAQCIYQMLKFQAERNPDAVAIVSTGRASLTYGGLLAQVDYVIKVLSEMGLGRSDRVAIVLPNGSEMAVTFLAVTAGAISAPLNPNYRSSEFDFYLSDLDARALIVQSGMDSPAIAVAQKRGISIIELSPMPNTGSGIFTLSGDEISPEPVGNLVCPDDIALVLHTSGTTSRPKVVPLTHKNICTSAYNIRTALNLTEDDRCLNVMPLFHIHGLVGAVLSSLVAGASIVCTPDFHAPEFFRWLEEFRPTWYTAVPTMHQAILARAATNSEVVARCPLRFIRSSSSALPSRVMLNLESAFKTPVIEAYGMTEASHQMTSNPLPPKERKPGSVGTAAGPEVAIMDKSGNLLPHEETGEIVIRGDNVMSGYENNPTANRNAFVGGWFRTGDQGYLDSDNYLFITGRLKEIINRGGEKVAPREVDEVLMAHPAIAQAVTFAVPHARLGEEVAAAVVLQKGFSATQREIQEFAAARLSDFKVPRHILILDEIPKGSTGKLQRIGLAERLGLTALYQADGLLTEVKPEPAAPTTPTEEKLLEIWRQVLGFEEIGIHDNFFRSGGDSLLATRVLSRIYSTMQVELSFLDFFEAPTISGIAKVIDPMIREATSMRFIRSDG